MSLMFTLSFETSIILLELKMAVFPASHCWPTESRGRWRFGTRWHSVAEGGSGRARLPFDVARMVSLLAAVMVIPFGVGCSSESGVFMSHRLMVHPVSTAMTLGDEDLVVDMAIA